MDASQKRNIAAQYALRQIGRPYVWGGKGRVLWTPSGLRPHNWGENVFDCSGLVSCAYLEATKKDFREIWGAGDYWKNLPKVSMPLVGSVACYGKRFCTHVMLVVNEHGMTVGASGGTSKTTTPQKARAESAMVDALNYNYRPDFLGFVDPVYG